MMLRQFQQLRNSYIDIEKELVVREAPHTALMELIDQPAWGKRHDCDEDGLAPEVFSSFAYSIGSGYVRWGHSDGFLIAPLARCPRYNSALAVGVVRGFDSRRLHWWDCPQAPV